jgi:hypothetical protein
MTEYRTCPRCGKRKPESSFQRGLAICAVCAIPEILGKRADRRGNFIRIYQATHIRERLNALKAG